MSDPTLSTEGAALADAALVHSARIEVVAAAAGLQEWPLDAAAAVRMRHVLAERVPSAQQALSRLQSQSPLPGEVLAVAPRLLRALPGRAQQGAPLGTPDATDHTRPGGWLGSEGGAAS